jgi:cell division protein FtsI/penicillin-binding protein 2
MIPIFAITIAAALGGPPPDYIVIDARNGVLLEQRWPDMEAAIPVGSLVKPFLAYAYGGAFPEFTCRGASAACWLARGHGSLHFREALGASCNAYFLNLARGVDRETLATTCTKFGIPQPRLDTPQARIGLGDDWRIPPLALARAYAELAARRAEPLAAEILSGLALAAQSGTAAAVGPATFAKTGTAPCTSRLKDAGDGLAVVIAPADLPRIVLLVRVHGVPGSEAAKFAARLLREQRAGK